MLTPTADLLMQASENGYAIGAFNVYNLEGVKAVVQAAEAAHSPVILQLHPKALEYARAPLVALCLKAAEDAAIPMAVHLDHSTSPAAIRSALTAGASSIMADGSHLDYADNVTFTRAMADLAHAKNAAVEAELGRISGTEDGLTVADFAARMTDPDQAAEFVALTGIDALAVCIGNVHGHYPGEPRLDFDRLAVIREKVKVPLVLHGTSGLSDTMITRAISLGVCKFNVNTEIRTAYLDAVRVRLNVPEVDLLDVMTSAIDAMQVVIADKLKIFGRTAADPLFER